MEGRYIKKPGEWYYTSEDSTRVLYESTMSRVTVGNFDGITFTLLGTVKNEVCCKTSENTDADNNEVCCKTSENTDADNNDAVSGGIAPENLPAIASWEY